MHVPFQVKIPLDEAARLRKLLDEIAVQHLKELRAASTPARFAQLNARGKKLTTLHLLRALVLIGLEHAKLTEVLKRIDADTVVVGRPRGTRAA